MKKTAWTMALLALPVTMTSALAQMESAAETSMPEAADAMTPEAIPADEGTMPSDAPVTEASMPPPVEESAQPATEDASALAAAPDVAAAPSSPPVDTPPPPEPPEPLPVADSGTYPDMSKPGLAIAERFYIAPMFDYSFADSDRRSDDGLGGRFIIGKQIAQGFHLELSGLYARYDAKSGSGKEELKGIGLSALVFPSTHFSGFFGSAGVSYAKGKSSVATTPDSDKDSTVWNVGLGYLVGPFAWLNDGSLRLEARYQADEKHVRGVSSDFLEPVLSAGLLIPIGAAPTPPPPPAEPVQVVPVVTPPDSDSDGVPDDRDQCPDSPPGSAVNDIGCPLPPPCKPPEAGQRVDLSGCAAGDTIVLRGVNFDFDNATLTVNAKTILDGVSDALAAAPDVQVEIGGHTDSRGADEYNQQLSERRAAAVMQYLLERGVSPARMTSAGYGEMQPVADNDSEEGRELNRRVELKITAGSASASTPPVAPAAEDSLPDAAPAELPAEAPVPELEPMPSEPAPTP